MGNAEYMGIDTERLSGQCGLNQTASNHGCFHSPGVLFLCHGDGGGGSYTYFSYHFWWVDITGARGTEGAVYHTICDDQRRRFRERPPSLELLQDERHWTNATLFQVPCSFLAPSLTEFFRLWAD